MVAVSIIIPVYNKGKYLRRCIDSILNQTYSDFEIILVDDGSLDKSKHIMFEYSTKYPQFVTVLEVEHEGVGNARNQGLKRAHGKYVLFVDADDYLKADYIAKLLEFSSFDLVVSGLLEQNANSKNIKSSISIINTKIDINSKSMGLIYTKRFFPIFSVVYTKLFKKKFIDEHHLKFRNQQYGEDTLFVLDYIKYVKKIKIISYAGYVNFITKNTLSRKYIPNIWNYLKVIPDEISVHNGYWQFLFMRSVKLALLNDVIEFKKFRYQCNIITNDVRFQYTSLLYVRSYSDKLVLILLKLKIYWLLFIIVKSKSN